MRWWEEKDVLFNIKLNNNKLHCTCTSISTYVHDIDNDNHTVFDLVNDNSFDMLEVLYEAANDYMLK
jgi:hypothetical protein